MSRKFKSRYSGVIYNEIFSDKEGSLLEDVGKLNRHWVSEQNRDVNYIEYQEPKVYEETRTIVFDKGRLLWTLSEQAHGDGVVGKIRIKYTKGGKLEVSVI